jgi:hypothetical protein
MSPFWSKFKPSKLPQEALDELRAILDNYDRLRQTNPPANAGDDAEMTLLRDKLNRDSGKAIWWTDLLLAELCVIDLVPQEQLLARVPPWRQRYQEVVGKDSYADYLKTAPDLTQTPTPQAAVLRADLYELIRNVYYFYAGYGVSARSRTQVTKSLMSWAAGIIAIEAAVIALAFIVPLIASLGAHAGATEPAASSIPPPRATRTSARVPSHVKPARTSHSGQRVSAAKPASSSQSSQRQPGATSATSPPWDWQLILAWLLATSAAAVIGCVVSVQRRLQDPTVRVDPFYRYIQTNADWFGIAIANPVFAAFFGMIMYGLLVSNFLSTKLIARFDEQGYPSATDHATQAGLLIFGFISGFAEQLIPDALTRLASAALTGLPSTPSGTSQGTQRQEPSPQPQGPSGPTQSAQQDAATTIKSSDLPLGVQILTGSPALQPTSEAALLGHNPSLASEASANDLDEGAS